MTVEGKNRVAVPRRSNTLAPDYYCLKGPVSRREQDGLSSDAQWSLYFSINLLCPDTRSASKTSLDVDWTNAESRVDRGIEVLSLL
jgi:hypothetical protein